MAITFQTSMTVEATLVRMEATALIKWMAITVPVLMVILEATVKPVNNIDHHRSHFLNYRNDTFQI